MDSPAHENGDRGTAFRKPSNDAANRKYRRRSQVNDGSSSDGSLERNRSPSPNHSRGEIRKVSEPNNARKDDRRESDRDSDRSRYGRGGESYRHDRYSKREDYSRRERDADENGRKHRSSPSRSSRDSRGGHYSDRRRVETERSRSRSDWDRRSLDKHSGSDHRSKDYDKGEELSSDRAGSGRRHADSRSEEKEKDYAGSRDRLDEKRDFRRSSADCNFHDEKKENRGSDIKEKDTRFKCPRDRSEYKSGFASEKLDTQFKKLKGFSSDKFTDGKSEAEAKLPSSSKPAIGVGDKESTGQSGVSGDLDAAKVAAMKAAELVNKNLVGTGILTTDQKKKLLWGNKKSAAAEETAHHWDNALIGDRERQEKFNKLMSLRLPWYIWPIVGCEGKYEARGEAAERSGSAGREAEGAADGSGEAVHSRTSPEGWTHRRVRSLIAKPLSCFVVCCGCGCGISLYSAHAQPFIITIITTTLHSMCVTSDQIRLFVSIYVAAVYMHSCFSFFVSMI